MTVEKAIRELGAREELLSEEERATLDENGYLPLAEILNEEQVAGLRNRFDQLVEAEGQEGGKEVHQEQGTNRLANLIDKGEVFQICISHPKVLAAMRHVLGPEFKLSSLNGRAALPGQGDRQTARGR